MRHWMSVFALLLLPACPDSDPAPPGGDSSDDVALADVAVDGGGQPDANEPDAGPDVEPDAGPPVGSGIFRAGCPQPGRATAMRIDDPEMRMHGPSAMGGEGDFLLLNEHVAFIVAGLEWHKTYWYYDGILVDIVPVAGCEQAGEERFGELIPLFGQLDAGDFVQSTMRGLRGESIEVLTDGSDGGAAAVRVTGVDDLFWLTELTLARAAYENGDGKALSEPLGLELWTDYILEPGSQVLRVEVNMRNLLAEKRPMLSGFALFFDDTTRHYHYTETTLQLGGYGLELGLPWKVAEAYEGDGAYSFGVPGGIATSVSISGVQGLLDANQITAAPMMSPAGEDGDTIQKVYFIAVGATDGNSATRELSPLHSQWFTNAAHSLEPFVGAVVGSVSGDPIAGVSVAVDLRNGDGDWKQFDSFISDAAGEFAGELAHFGDPALEYRLRASIEGRPTPDAMTVTLDDVPVTIEIDPSATLEFDVRNPDGMGLPARILLFESGTGSRVAQLFSVTGSGSEAVPPGTYDVVVERGFEYTRHEETLDFPANQTTQVTAVLERVVDTTGWLSIDSHIHAAPSWDSTVPIPTRLIMAAAVGLEVPVNTDHEAIVDYRPVAIDLGLDAWLSPVTGQEVTATVPEHHNMYPVEVDPSIDGRGGIVAWYGLDVATLHQAIRDRGAGVVQLNHPRGGYLSLIQWDRIAGAPGVSDLTGIGFPPDAELWSWNFDAIELFNDSRDPFLDPADPHFTGLFEDWQSFYHHGHRIAGVAVTDTHGMSPPGMPRTYFAAPTDEPSELTYADVTAAVKGGHVLTSSGAFARVTVNGTAGPGDDLTDTDGEVDVQVHIEAIPQVDITHFKVLVNCDQVATVAADDPAAVVKYDGTVTVPVTADANLIVMGFGVNDSPRGWEQYDATRVPRFVTNPVFIDADGNGQWDAPGGKTCTYDLDPPG